jgi:hypothetical protein
VYEVKGKTHDVKEGEIHWILKYIEPVPKKTAKITNAFGI